MRKIVEVALSPVSELPRIFGAVQFENAHQVTLDRADISAQQGYAAIFEHPPELFTRLMRLRGTPTWPWSNRFTA